MELRGDFQSYSEVLDLLQIVAMGKKTGEIKLKNEEGKETITITFKEGKAVNFDSNSPVIQKLRERVVRGELSIEDALTFLLHHVSMWDQGHFLFVEGKVDEEEIGSGDAINVMMNFTKEVDETPAEVRSVLKENRPYGLSQEAELPVEINEEDWKLLITLSKQEPIWNAVLKAGSSYNQDIQTVKKLIERKLIKPAELLPPSQEETEEEAVIPKEKMEKVKELLIETMGPMGEFLIDETLEELDLEVLTRKKVPKFIEILIDKIPESCLVEGEKCKDRLREQISGLLKGGSDDAQELKH